MEKLCDLFAKLDVRAVIFVSVVFVSNRVVLAPFLFLMDAAVSSCMFCLIQVPFFVIEKK